MALVFEPIYMQIRPLRQGINPLGSAQLTGPAPDAGLLAFEH